MAKKRGYFILYRDIYSNPIFKNLLNRYTKKQLIDMIEKESE